jgi:hypothetical protein
MTAHARKALARRSFEEIWNHADLALIDDLIAPEYLHRDPATPGGIAYGRDGLRQLIAAYRATLPGLRFEIDGQIAEAEVVVTWWTATGAGGTVTGVTITRFAGNLILEDHVHWDNLGTLLPCGFE